MWRAESLSLLLSPFSFLFFLLNPTPHQLIERGASVDLPKGKGKQQITPVAFFAAAGGHQVLFQLLLKRGAVLDRVFGSLSVLHVAIHHNKLGFADSALQKGLSPDIGSEVLSPLHLSCMEGNLEAGLLWVFFLFSSLLSLSFLFSFFSSLSRTTLSLPFDFLFPVRLLIDYGGKVVPQFGAPSALHFAATYGAIGVIDTLLSAGCPLDSMATAGTPLCCACRARQLQVPAPLFPIFFFFFFHLSFYFLPLNPSQSRLQKSSSKKELPYKSIPKNPSEPPFMLPPLWDLKRSPTSSFPMKEKQTR